ncbi:hypothetical protein DMENIID0001_169130 [Sergentomyia squamirostris]
MPINVNGEFGKIRKILMRKGLILSSILLSRAFEEKVFRDSKKIAECRFPAVWCEKAPPGVTKKKTATIHVPDDEEVADACIVTLPTHEETRRLQYEIELDIE